MMNGNHKEILKAIDVTLKVIRTNHNTNMFIGFTPSMKHYGLSIKVSFVDGVTAYLMNRFTDILQKCLPQYNISDFEIKTVSGATVWAFKVIGDVR